MQERLIGSVVVLDISGKSVLGVGLLKDKIHSLVFQGRREILLNLGAVSYVDSSGLGELVAAFTTVARAGGQIKLLNLTKRVHDLLAITKLVTVFETFDQEAAAVESFAAVV